MLNLINDMEFNAALTDGKPQAIMKMVMTIKGDHARKTCAGEYFNCASIVCGGSSLKRQLLFGFQNFRKTMRQTMEAMPAITSGSMGPK